MKKLFLALVFGPQPFSIAFVGLFLYTLIYELNNGYAAFQDEESNRWLWFFLGGMAFSLLAQFRQRHDRG